MVLLKCQSFLKKMPLKTSSLISLLSFEGGTSKCTAVSWYVFCNHQPVITMWPMTPHITVGEVVQKTIPDYRHPVHSARLCCLEHAAPRGLTAHRRQPCSTPGWQEQWTWGLVDHRKMLYMILVALCKTVVSPVLMHWRYHSPALSH